MSSTISGATAARVPLPAPVIQTKAAAEMRGAGPSFQEVLRKSLAEADAAGREAASAAASLQSSGAADTAEVLGAVQKAEVAYRMMMQMRDELAQAYQQIQNLQI